MSQFAKRLLSFGGGLLVFGILTSVLALTVSYKPYGVPDSRREDYETAVAELVRRNELAESIDKTATPVATIDQTVYDFGKLDPHATASHSFVVRNEGGDPLTLSVRETSCKCTVGKLGKAVVMPGEETEVTMTWNTGYKAETYEQSAVVATNDPLKEVVVLKVRGTVRSDLVMPKSIGMPKADLGSATTMGVTIYSQLWENFTIEDVSSEMEGFQWHAEPMDLSEASLADREPVAAWKLHVELPVLKPGSFSDEMTVSINPGTGEPTIQRVVQISGKTRSPIAFMHPQISAGGLEIGTLVSGKEHRIPLTVRLRGNDLRTLDVLKVDPEQLQATLTATDDPRVFQLHVIIPKDCPMITFDRDDRHGYVQVGDPDDPSFQNWFPLFGAVVELDQ